MTKKVANYILKYGVPVNAIATFLWQPYYNMQCTSGGARNRLKIMGSLQYQQQHRRRREAAWNEEGNVYTYGH